MAKGYRISYFKVYAERLSFESVHSSEYQNKNEETFFIPETEHPWLVYHFIIERNKIHTERVKRFYNAVTYKHPSNTQSISFTVHFVKS